MSRTDKTAPWRVKAFYYPHWITDHHDHSRGPCSLPPKATVANVKWWHRECGWTFARGFIDHPLQRCCCPICHRDAFQLRRAKRERMAGKRYTRDGWRKEY